jgi:hypothetical protein
MPSSPFASGGHVMQETESRQLTPLEYAEMMRKLDEAQEWMTAQLHRQRQIAQEPAPDTGDASD